MIIQILSIAVVLVIVFFTLRQQHRKEKAYFGGKVEPTGKQKKILEKYKREYTPVPPDPRLATLAKDKWELEDIAHNATQFVYDAPLPPLARRHDLKPGELVKLCFITEEEEEETDVERMWVKVTGKENGLYYGTLDNDPFTEHLKAGQTIWFHANHVLMIDEGK
jgi:hypothetical protein